MKIRCDLVDEIARSKTQCCDGQLSIEADPGPFIYGLDFSLFWQVPEKNSWKATVASPDSLLLGFSSMLDLLACGQRQCHSPKREELLRSWWWPECYRVEGVETRHIGQIFLQLDTSSTLSHFLIMPSDYEFIEGLIHWSDQSPQDCNCYSV